MMRIALHCCFLIPSPNSKCIECDDCNIYVRKDAPALSKEYNYKAVEVIEEEKNYYCDIFFQNKTMNDI